MKTLREILLARHKAIESRLDDIRQVAIAELNNKDTKAQSQSKNLTSSLLVFPKIVWRELVWPSRRIWVGLVTVWLVLLAVNFSMRDHSEIRMVKSPPSPEVIMALRQQQQLLSELIGPDDPPVAEPKKTYLPRPASKRRLELLMS